MMRSVSRGASSGDCTLLRLGVRRLASERDINMDVTDVTDVNIRRSRRRAIGIGAAMLPIAGAMAAGSVLTPARAAGTTIVAPTFVRTIGTSGESTTYPSGVAVDASGSVYIADTGNYRIEKYKAGTTTLLWSVGVRGAPIGPAGSGNDSFTAPRDVATDGSFVYVADTDN